MNCDPNELIFEMGQSNNRIEQQMTWSFCRPIYIMGECITLDKAQSHELFMNVDLFFVNVSLRT